MTPYEKIEKAIDTFREYAEHHALKEPPDQEKVDRNVIMGCDLEDALEELRAADINTRNFNKAMERTLVLKILMLLSALESWSFSLSKQPPDYLHDEVTDVINELKEEVFK